MHIAVELDQVLKNKNISLYEFCKIADISYQQGHDIVKKKTKAITFDLLEKLCTYLGCSIDDLLVMTPDSKGFLKSVLDKFDDTDNVKRIPKTRATDNAKPILQWVGGKREMISQYEKHFPKKITTYHEPFFGGGALLFHIKPKHAVVNDNNPELVTTYNAIRDNVEEVIDLLLLLRRKHSKELYMKIRSIDREIDIYKQLKPTEIAARMIYLNQTGFNGVYRVNKKGQYNVPIGSSLNRVICDPVALRRASESLANVELLCEDFAEVVNKVKPNDFVYFDPPYFPISEYSDFTRYTKEKFYKEDQTRLAETFKKLDRIGAKVMLSNSNSEFIKDLYSDFNVIEVLSSRNLNSKKDKRGKITELLVTNYGARA